LRWRIPVVLAVTVFVNYLDRNNLAIALPRIADNYGWSEKELGNNGQYLLAAFFLAYGLSNMLLSPAAERFGPKKSVMGAIIAFSICTILSAPFGQILAALIVLRLLLGLGEGVHFPMLSTITSQWFKPHERSRANAIWDVGVLVATATAPLLLVPLIDSIGWQATFAILGTVGLVISVPLVWFFVQENPDAEAPSVQIPTVHEELAVVETVSYTRNKYFWLMVLGGILNAFCAFGVLNWLPSYFNKAKGIDFDQLGWPLALVFSAGIVGVLVLAIVGDKLNRRILLASGGFIVAGSMVPLAASSQDINLVVFWLAIGVFCQSAYTASEFAIVQHFLPSNKIGAGSGLYNGLTVLFGGVGGSFIPGTLVSITGDFTSGLIGVMIGAYLAGIVYFFLSRAVKY
jgi:sugar phosphate permease